MSTDHDAELAEHVRRIVDQAPPLTPAQRDRLAALLPAPRDQHDDAA